MFEIFECDYIPDKVIPVGSPIRIFYTGITVVACVFIAPEHPARYDFLTLSALYAQTRSTNQFMTEEEFCAYYAEAMQTYDPESEPPLLYHEYVEAFQHSKDYITRIIENIVERKAHLDSIYFLRSLILHGLNIEKITNLYEKLMSEEVEYRYLSSKAKLIQKRYKRAISDPNCTMCKTRLMREWNQLVDTF